MVAWNHKLAAFLHDPLDKPFGIQDHIARASANFHAALGREATPDEREAAKIADWWASAADRADFPTGLLADFRKSSALTHPLSGRRKLDLETMQTVEIGNTVLETIQQLCQGETDERRKFLRLWHELVGKLETVRSDIGALWRLLPADTRQPEHALPQHLSMASALASAGESPAFLVFSIGPVQDFIAAARRTQDLWMGSYLLSYLSWVAMQSVAETYGPDAVVFPSLRNQPMVAQWLAKSENIGAGPNPHELSIANLPNKFTAILPADEAQQAAQNAERAVRERWTEIANDVRQYLLNLIPVSEGNVWHSIWDRQINSLPEVYWSVLPWLKTPDEARDLYNQWVGTDEHFERVYALYQKRAGLGGGQYDPNIGTTYQLLYDLAERGFNARKNLRNFQQADEKGEQCSVMPGYAALHNGEASLKGVRQYWGEIYNVLAGRGNRAALKPNGGERLSAIGAIKRFAAQAYFKDHLELDERYPSITSLTVFPFYVALAENWEKGDFSKLVNEMAHGLSLAKIPQTILENSLPPYLQQRLNGLLVLRDLVRFDGEWLYPDTYERAHSKYEPGIDTHALPELKNRLRKLLDRARECGIPSPPRYYAILHMDGDHMGHWLSGTHQDMPNFADLLHPDIAESLAGRPEWDEWLKEKRLVSPAFHAAVSEALGNFALKCVRRVVEDFHPGVLIYAGGDDVLALLPLEHALPVARELRAAFSGQATISKTGVEDVDFTGGKHTGYMGLEGEKYILTMGPSATASVGLAIAHHSAALSGVLAAARQAEKAAKEHYGRNALAVTVLKRSGEVIRMGAQWYYAQVPDSAALVHKFQNELKDDRNVASKFVHTYFAEARTLAGLMKDAPESLQAELRRLLKRHTNLKGKEVDEFAQLWSKRLTALAVSLSVHREETERKQSKLNKPYRTIAEEDELPQPGAVELGKWLLLARFLNRGGDE